MLRQKQGICLLLVFKIAFVLNLSAQDIEQTLALANQQYEKAQYTQAISYYQRILFFDKKNYNSQIHHRLANCFFNTGNYEKAAESYDIAWYSEENDSIKTELVFKKTSSLLLQNKFQFALIEILNLKDDLSIDFQKRKEFYSGIIYFGLEDFVRSESHFKLVFSEKVFVNELEKLFKKNQKIEKLNPKTARILSMVIPGLGQFYSGDIKNGINSLLLTGLFAYLYVNTAINFSFLEGYLIVFPWFHRYYTGGYKRAGINTEKIKSNKRAVIYQEIITLIEKSNS
ncbi:MAG: tetratricopeptide repeat protein [Bacteroidetes bacterium]|nr:tetratricopeptide repeat protein [Bacteroidota bacterium]HET6243237.1 tetratricopeptide repeat protein [Bacteroidia bacterium]